MWHTWLATLDYRIERIMNIDLSIYVKMSFLTSVSL